MKHIRKPFVLLFLVLISVQLSGQDYAVNVKGDTLRGNIKVFSYSADKKIQVTSPDSKKQTIPLLQLRSFTKENEIFHPVKGPNGYDFMKLISAGYLSLYAFQPENQVTYDGTLINKRDGTFLEIPNLNFKKLLKKYLGDCPAVADKIEDGTYSRRDVQRIVDDYNACMDKSTLSQVQGVSQNAVQVKQSGPWELLDEKVSAKNEFNGKSDALEMITEVRSKISRSEKVPNFLIEGLKNALKDADLSTELQAALNEIK